MDQKRKNASLKKGRRNYYVAGEKGTRFPVPLPRHSLYGPVSALKSPAAVPVPPR